MPSSPVYLSSAGQKILKGFHLTFVAVSLGGLLYMFGLFLLKINNPDVPQETYDETIYFLNNSVVYFTVFGLVLTTMIYSLYTKLGFFKHDWVLMNWVLLIGMAVIFMIVFNPSINGMAPLSDAGLNISSGKEDYEEYMKKGFFWNFVLIGILIGITIIYFMKPWASRAEDLISNVSRIRRLFIFTTLFFLVFGIMGTIDLNKLKDMPVKDSTLQDKPDGIYEGAFEGGGNLYSVQVELKDEQIIQIESQNDEDSKYEKFSQPILERIIQQQNANVDAITGATTTSKCVMKAVENALSK